MLFLVFCFTLVVFSETSEDKKKREYAEYIIEDQRIYLNICKYYTNVIRTYCNYLITYSNVIPNDSIPQLVEKVTSECSRDLYKYEKEYKTLIANTYMHYYTLKELKELMKFYKSPLGAKLWQAQEDINAEIYKNTDMVILQILENINNRLEPYLKQKILEKTKKDSEL